MNNSSRTACDQQDNQGLRVLSMTLPIAIAIIVANGVVFFLFLSRKSLRTKSNYFLFGLAVCDFLTGTVNIPYYIVFNFNVVPSWMCNQYVYWLYGLHTLTAVSAAYHILVITAEKYLAILQPLNHHIVTKKAVFKVLVGIWFISGLIAVIPLTWHNTTKSNLGYTIHSSFCLAFVFLVPYVFMLYAYTMMFKAVAGRKRPLRQRHKQQLQRKNRTDRKCILVFALMAAIYLCCWLPYFTLMFTYYISKSSALAIAKAMDVFSVIRYITSVTNPLLYTFFKRDFWTALHGISVKRKPSSDEESTLTTGRGKHSFAYFSVKRPSNTSISTQPYSLTSM